VTGFDGLFLEVVDGPYRQVAFGNPEGSFHMPQIVILINNILTGKFGIAS